MAPTAGATNCPPKRREDRLARIKAAKQALEARAKADAAAPGAPPDEAKPPKSRCNFTDPESRESAGRVCASLRLVLNRRDACCSISPKFKATSSPVGFTRPGDLFRNRGAPGVGVWMGQPSTRR